MFLPTGAEIGVEDNLLKNDTYEQNLFLLS